MDSVCPLCNSEPSDGYLLDGQLVCAGCYEEETFYLTFEQSEEEENHV